MSIFAEIARSIKEVGTSEVLVLPNDKNVVLAAEQAAALVRGQTVVVIPTHNVPQGIAAALAVNPEETIDGNKAAVDAAIRRCHCIEIAVAARDARLHQLHVHAGELLAFVDDVPVAAATTAEAALEAALAALPAQAYDLAAIYIGSGATPAGAMPLAALLTERLGVPVETTVGDHPHYLYTISVE